MDFITADQVEGKKNKDEVALHYNAQIFFSHIVNILTIHENEKMREKYSYFLNSFLKYLQVGKKLKFIEINGKHVVSTPDAKLVYFKDDYKKPIRIYITREEVK
jgi:hypothetical protein